MPMWYPVVIRKANKAINDPSGFARLAGAGLSQIVDEMIHGPFAIISAHIKVGQTPEERAENNAQQKKLKEYLHSIDKSWVDMHGAWNYKDENISPFAVKEHSVFIPNISKDEALDMGRMFGQEGIIIGDNGKYEVTNSETGEPFLQDDKMIPLTGDVMTDIRVNPNPEESDPYSLIKGKRFKFEPPADEIIAASSFNWIPRSYCCYASGQNAGPPFTDAREGLFTRIPKVITNIEHLDVCLKWWQEGSSKPIRTGEKP